MKTPFIHNEEYYNLDAPLEIVPSIIKLLNPKSVVDIGCGIGTFLYCFKKEGIQDVLGIDRPETNKKLLSKYLLNNEFQQFDLEKKLILPKKYDLAISLEVAEHIKPEYADIFVENLINAGDVILFSAAIPLQLGKGHFNEQWLTYWEEKFNKRGFVIHDVFRPMFWDNPKINWWYKQNMVLITPKGFNLNSDVVYNPLRNVVHYELFAQKSIWLEEIFNGRLKKSTYLKLFVKSVFGIINYNKIKRIFKKSLY